MAKLSPEELKRTTELLERLDSDRTLLSDFPEEARKAFLRAVGRVAIPERDVQNRLAKAVRRKKSQQQKAAKREKDRATRSEVQIRAVRAQAVYQAPALPSGSERPPERELETPRHCYVCKADYRRLHFFYDTMCTACGDLNHRKRFQTAPLEGKVALITGARVKIGYQASLMLLRSGARVIATTRFPLDAAERYARETDFVKWGHRLEVHGLDLRHAPSVEVFARHIEATHERLDILINNAAQTVRRPPGFYRHLLETESRRIAELPAQLKPLLEARSHLLEKLEPPQADALATSWRSSDAAVGIHHSAALSLLPYELEQDVDHLFPAGKLDADLQQVDRRLVNSWRLTLSEVQTAEMLEVHLVNAVAPFILCGKLKPLMLRHRQTPGHIVNVSAMEGSFSRGTKTDKHPHTNMAKAALNMMTLTSAPDYAKGGIYMNAVDTGWVTDEDPMQHAERKQSELDFHPPLDIVDGAARVVDPVFEAERTGKYVYGKFFKDYAETDW